VSNNWSAPTSLDEVRRRAGGRRHYNAWRQHLALFRRCKVSRLLGRYKLFERGTVTAIARELGVSVATVSRDLQAMLREHQPCPHCGAFPILGPDPEETAWVDRVLDDTGPAGPAGPPLAGEGAQASPSATDEADP
jgi:hypothetical protein